MRGHLPRTQGIVAAATGTDAAGCANPCGTDANGTHPAGILTETIQLEGCIPRNVDRRPRFSDVDAVDLPPDAIVPALPNYWEPGVTDG